jgi:nucleotide-binding universal stress UspA family protein
MSHHQAGDEMSFVDTKQTIVVAADLEGRCEAALEYARKLAGAYEARIVLAHGIDPLDYVALEAVPGNVVKRMPERARAVLDGLAADLIRDGIHSHSEVRQGEVVQMLLDVARQYDAGLLVVGTRGREGAGPVAVGTIAEQLVRRASFPVLAVAEDWNAGEFRPVPGGPIMLAMARNEATEAAMKAACSLAAKFHRTLIVVHARTAAEASAFLNPCATTLEQFGLKSSGAFPIRCEVKDGRPAEAIARAIAQHSPSILVAGVKRKSESLGVHGTVFSLLAGSRVPVLCVPAQLQVQGAEQDTSLAAEVI